MSKYAEKTSVSSDRSRAEIEKTLIRYGATGFAYGWETDRAVIGFSISNRHVRFTLPMPSSDSKEFVYTVKRGTKRSDDQIQAAYEQAVRQRWRALALAIKAKLEAVDSEITTFEKEFLAHIVLPNGLTVGNWISPQIENSYKTAQMPALIAGVRE